MHNIKDYMHKQTKKLYILGLIIVNVINLCFAEVGISLGWPYIGIKYNFSKQFGSELRLANDGGINVYSGRGYWIFSTTNKLNLFSGLELGFITFNTLDIKGAGYETSVFLGGEYFVSPQMSFAIDFAPTFIGVSSDNISVDGLEIVVNFALNYYLNNKK
jgi:hypothetical protein